MSTDLQRLVYFAEDEGVHLELERSRGKLWLLNISRDNAKKGTGRVIMDALCELADETGENIHLAVALGAPELVRYYESFGFALDGGGDDDEPTMVRLQPVAETA